MTGIPAAGRSLGTSSRWILSLCLLLLFTGPSLAQVDEARQAMDRGEYVRAVTILSEALATRPMPDTYLYLGIAYHHMKEYQKAEDVLNEGSKRYPDDPRFHNELANVFLENNDIDAAKSELQRALAVDPNNNYASDELANIDLSEGELQSALRSWNKSGRPFINDILHNYYLNFGSWVVRRAVTFHPAGTLHYSEWKTTESRLLETDNFANVGLEIEPTRIPDQYNAVVRTATKTNSRTDFLFNLLKGAPVHTSYVDVWNIGNSGINFNGNYRWDTDRRRAEGRLKIPVPIAGLVHLEIGNTWRYERWDLSPTIRPESRPRARFDYKANALQVRVKHIPHYRVEVAAGFEYRNRAARGALPVEDYFVLGLDTHPANLLRGHTVADHGRYGRGPMGTDFVLMNTDIERRLATIPFFNTVSIPFISVKWNLFFDGAKTWDRNRIFRQSKLLLDTGGGLRFETPTYSFNLVYGRSLREGKNVLFAYYERRLW